MLANYPDLEAWYKKGGEHNGHLLLAEKLCKALSSGELSEVFVAWRNVCGEVFASPQTYHQGYLPLENFLQSYGFNLSELHQIVGEFAISKNHGESFRDLMQRGARLSGKGVLFYLSAWASFNMDSKQDCILECALAPKYGPLLSLWGQALLEEGHIDLALAKFEEALRFDVDDVLTWFQIAKAEYLRENYKAVYDALAACERLRPADPEVAVFAAINSLASLDAGEGESEIYLRNAWDLLGNNEMVLRMKVGIALKNESLLLGFLDDLMPGQMLKALLAEGILGKILKNLSQLGWREASLKVLT